MGFAITQGLDDQIKTPYSEVFNLSLQRELKGGFTLEADYVGRLGRHLLQQLDLAQPLNLVDKVGGMDYYTAATMLSKDVDAGMSPSQVQAIPYFENLFPDAAGLDTAGDGAVGNSATENIYADLGSTFVAMKRQASTSWTRTVTLAAAVSSVATGLFNTLRFT